MAIFTALGWGIKPADVGEGVGEGVGFRDGLYEGFHVGLRIGLGCGISALPDLPTLLPLPDLLVQEPHHEGDGGDGGGGGGLGYPEPHHDGDGGDGGGGGGFWCPEPHHDNGGGKYALLDLLLLPPNARSVATRAFRPILPTGTSASSLLLNATSRHVSIESGKWTSQHEYKVSKRLLPSIMPSYPFHSMQPCDDSSG